MALTKEKLTILLQTQIGMSRNESRHTLDRLFRIMKNTLAQGEDLLISGFGKFSVREKKGATGEEPSNQKESDHSSSEGFGV